VLAKQRELFAVQVAALQDRTRAEALRLTMERKYGVARIVPRQGSVMLWRVLVGEEDAIEKADVLAGKLHDEGSQGFVVRLDPPVTVR
jgi:cell division septation protein DedD